MYVSQIGGPPRTRLRRMPGTVVALGVVSLLTDVSSEMITAFLPLYLVYTLQISYVQFGLLDGIYTGATAVLRIVGGHLADRWRRSKAVAGAGYLLSAITRIGLLAVGGSGFGIGSMIAIDRAGKGLRTSPRDAMIALAAPAGQLGAAFGVHRTMDTIGALLGPLLTFLLLVNVGTAAEPIFVVSTCFAVMGILVLVGFVPEEARKAPAPAVLTKPADRPSMRQGLTLLRQSGIRRAAIVAALLGLTTMSDAFVFLTAQRSAAVSVGVLPLLPLGTAAVFLLAATPVGRLADRVGRHRTFLAGHLLLTAIYVLIRTGTTGMPILVAIIGLHGLFYAATDGVLSAWVSQVVAEELRASGLALVQTAQALARFASSIAVGVLLTAASLGTVMNLAVAALAVTLVAATAILGNTRTPTPSSHT